MSTPTAKVGGASVYYYTPDTSGSPLSAPSAPTSGDITDLTTAPGNAINATSIAGNTAYSIRLANIGLNNDNGGLAITDVSDAYSHTTAADAVGFKISHTFATGVLAVAVFVDGKLATLWPSKPTSRATGASHTRDIYVYYTPTSDALLYNDSIIGGTAYPGTRISLPDTSEGTTINLSSDTVEITPAHSSNYNVQAGRSFSCTFNVYNNDPGALAFGTGGLRVNAGSEDMTMLGFRGSAVPFSRPIEVHVPGDSDENKVWTVLTCETESQEWSQTVGKTEKPGFQITLSEIPDTVTKGVFTVFYEDFQ